MRVEWVGKDTVYHTENTENIYIYIHNIKIIQFSAIEKKHALNNTCFNFQMIIYLTKHT